jgi:hypothetical protein
MHKTPLPFTPPSDDGPVPEGQPLPHKDVVEHLRRIEALLQNLRDDMLHRPTQGKEFYTTVEVASLLGRRPFTVREWCRNGRVHAEKTHSGRGAEAEWRISAGNSGGSGMKGCCPHRIDLPRPPPALMAPHRRRAVTTGGSPIGGIRS